MRLANALVFIFFYFAVHHIIANILHNDKLTTEFMHLLKPPETHRHNPQSLSVTYRRMLILRVTRNPTVTAGLMCPPLTWPIAQTIVATLRPNASEIRTTSPVSHEPQATTTSRNVPRNSASSANQNLTDLMSCKLVVDIFSPYDLHETTRDC